MSVSSVQFRVSRSAAVLGAALALAMAAGARAADPAEDLDLQYQTVLAVLKKPPVTGILITEAEPESAAAAAGLRAGDILLEYYGAKVTTLGALSQQVAEAIARRLEDEAAGKSILAKVRRGNEEKSFVLPRDLLGIRAVEVESGVPGPRNPAPNPRGTLALAWKAVLETLTADGAGADAGPAIAAENKHPVNAAFRLLTRTEMAAGRGAPRGAVPGADEEWAGWELCALTPQGDEALVGQIDMYHLMPEEAGRGGGAPADGGDSTAPATEHSTFTFRLRLGDYTTAPAFVLDQAGERFAAPAGQENMQYVADALRMGERLQVTSGLAPPDGMPGDGGRRTQRNDSAAPLNAAPQWALPWIAAALPQQGDNVLAVEVLSVRDMLARPGYVLVTRGRGPLPTDPIGADAVPAATRGGAAGAARDGEVGAGAVVTQAAADPWRVDLMHCGIVVESYWFTDQRRLVCVETVGPQSVVARRAQDAKSAAVPLERKRGGKGE